MIPPVAAPYLAGVALLGAAGVAKLARPNDTARALQASGLPGSRDLVRTGAGAEIAVAAAAICVPGPLTGALVASLYVVFAVFVVVAIRRRWPLSSCGCFGRPDTPPTPAHAVLNLGAAVAAIWWAAAWPSTAGADRLGEVLSHEPWHGGPLLFVSAVLAGLAYVVWTNPLPAARQSQQAARQSQPAARR